MIEVGGAALVLTPGRSRDRSALAAVRALASAGLRPVVGASGPGSLAAASKHSTDAISLPDPTEPGYAAAVADCSATVGALAVIPSDDHSLLALTPDHVALLDKSQLAKHASAAGLSVPPTKTFQSAADLVAAGDAIPYPAVIKPVLKHLGLPAYRAEGPGDLPVDRYIGPVIAQPFLREPMDAICGVTWSGTMVASLRQEYLRTWPAACGTASAARVVAPDEARTAALTRLLARYNGIFQAQFVGGALIDLNLRTYGSLPLAVRAGLNLPAIVCRLSAGEVVQEVHPTRDARYRWIEGDIRNQWHSLRKGELGLPSLLQAALPRRGTAHSVFAARDIQPTVARLRYAASVRRSSS